MPDTVSYLNLRTCVENLSRNPGAELVRYGRRRKDVLSLGQGEGSDPTPDFIIKGAERALAEGKTFYGPVLGHDDLRQEISNYYNRIYKLEIPTHRVFVTGSGTMAMHLALTALLDEGDEVAAVTPIWRNLLGAIELAEATIREVPLDEKDGKWSLDLDRLFASCNRKTKLILITSPSNPTGWVMSKAEMKAVLDFARERNLWILSDEVYGRLIYDTTRAPSFLDVAVPEDKLFTINSFSKAWAMTGWRMGWLTGPLEAEGAIRDIVMYDTFCPPTFTQYGAIEALRHGEDFIAEQLDLWRSNMDYLYDRLAAMGRISGAPPEATFYSFFRVDGETDCIAFARRLIDEQGLSLAPGCTFGKVGRGFIRLCFAVSRPRLEDAVDRLEAALKG